MVQYIDKAAVVAEIEKRIQVHYNDMNKYKSDISKIALGLCIEENKTILFFLNTIEAKEIDLEKELDKYTADNFWALDGNNESPYLVEKDDMLKVARHFYELGLKAKDVNEIIKTAEDPLKKYFHRQLVIESQGYKNKMFVSAKLMPHRIRITNLWYERLQDISDVDCLREGVIPAPFRDFPKVMYCPYVGCKDEEVKYYAKSAFAHLLDKVSGKGTWDLNPWVAVYSFKLVK